MEVKARRLARDAGVPDGEAGPEGLARTLGARDGMVLVFANVVGAGIFLTPGVVAAMVPSATAQLALWLGGGALALAGALAYAELAALRPRAGGEYVYIREAFGPLAGFLSGWTSFVAGFSGAIAAAAVGFAEYLGRFVPAAADVRPLATLPTLLGTAAVSPRALIALGVVATLSAIHVRGVRVGATVQNVMVGSKVALGAGLVAAGFAFGPTALVPPAPTTPTTAGSWLLAFIPIMFTYSGWNAAAYLAEEMRAPERNVPRALLWGTLAVTLFYLALNALFLHALPGGALAGELRVGDAAAAALFGSLGAAAVSIFVLLALATGISAMIVTGPRIYFAMARDGLFPEGLARVHPRWGTPAGAIVAQAVWSGVLVLSGTFEQLLTYTGFAIVLFAAIAVLSLFRLRHKTPQARRPFTMQGYPVVPALFVGVSLFIAANAVREQPGVTLAGLAVIAAGIPVFAWMRMRAS